MLLITDTVVVQNVSRHMVKINTVGIWVGCYDTHKCVTKSTDIIAIFFVA
jgi:hypothetical protein